MTRACVSTATLVLLVGLASGALAQAPGNLKVDGVPAITPATLERTAPYENTRSAELLDFAPEGGSALIATRFGDVAQVHEVAGPGRDRQQLTFLPRTDARSRDRPDAASDGFYFLMDTGGNERFRSTGSTGAAGSGSCSPTASRATSRCWSRTRAGGSPLRARDATARTSTSTRWLGAEPASTKLVASVAGRYAPASWSRDDRRLLLQNYVSANESHLTRSSWRPA